MTSHRDTLTSLRPNPEKQFISRGPVVWVTGLDGFVDEATDQGYYVHETRMLSRYRYLIDGRVPDGIALSNVSLHSWIGHYITTPPGRDIEWVDAGSGMMRAASECTLELRLSRRIDGHGFEEVELTNYSMAATAFELALEVAGDFADIQEVGGRRLQEGTLETRWTTERPGAATLALQYRAEHDFDHQGERGRARIERGLDLNIETNTSCEYRDGRIVFAVSLEPHQTWRARIALVARLEEGPGPALSSVDAEGRTRHFLEQAAACVEDGDDGLTSVVFSTLRRARHDLAGLRLFALDRDNGAWTMAAGLPFYAGFYGRDTLTAGWQAALLGPEMMEGALAENARWQGTRVNDWRDEQPGRMLHELHRGPLKALNFLPTGRNYGSLTTSAFYPVVVSELWHWTGDRERVRPYVGPAMDALKWLDESSRHNGFYSYRTRSEDGVRHQAWKDSPNAIVRADGSEVEPPIATCEEQGFVYAAKLQLSEVLWWLGEKDAAKRLFGEARELKGRFNEAFWMDDASFVAMGLDRDGARIRSIGSNPGHCIAAGILEKELARQTAQRLLADDLFTGWGIRTLSSDNPAYNPYSYHRGSVWPVEHGTFALGFTRYGLHDLGGRMCRAQFEAAGLFENYRLPEVFSGHRRSESQPFPAFYPRANAPQAWSASAVFCMVQAMLGLYPYAPLHMLILDPHLPSWLPELTVRGLRVGDARTTIRFERGEDGTSSYRVLEVEGTLHVLRQPSPWSLTAGYWDRLRDALTSLLPGK